MSQMLVTPGTDAHGMLIDLCARRGYRVHVRNNDQFEITKDNKCCFRGSAGEVHRWLRSKTT
jgi:hypothetical protein